MRLSRLPFIAAFAAGLAGCAVTEPLSLESIAKGVPRSVTVALIVESGDAGTQRGVFGLALAKSFADNAFAINPSALLVADYAIAVSGADAGMANSELQANEVDWLSEPRKERRFDECEAKRLRGSLALFNRETGAQVYRGSASQIGCDFSDQDVSEMAQALVRDALAEAQ